MKKRIEIEIEVPEGREFVELRPSGNGEFFNSPMGSSDHFQSWILTTKNVKTAKKVIDLSCIVGSGIDCEVAKEDFSVMNISKLVDFKSINNGRVKYKDSDTLVWDKCRVRQSPHVHFWKGGDRCPLPDGLKVEAYSDDGDIYEIETGVDDANFWRNCRVFGVEVLGVAEGWRYEWEEE